jgi:hypothetical protein
MRYELEPDNRNCSDEVLLDDLRAVARRLGKSSLTKEEYGKHGRFSPATITNRIGWNRALGKAGLAVQKRNNIPRDEMAADLKRVAEFLGAKTVTMREYSAHGGFANCTLAREFGSWANALAAAGLQSTGWKPKATEDELLQNMAAVWEHVGRQPCQSDFRPPISTFSRDAYVRRYGSWRKALEAFVASANDPQEGGDPVDDSAPLPPPADGVHKEVSRKTPRTAGWRLRHLVMRRDNFRCRHCGAVQSPPNVVLHIDHILPWSKGGETVMSNLQTLCNMCNIGKSDLVAPE